MAIGILKDKAEVAMGPGKRDQHDEWAIPRGGLSPIRGRVSPLCVAMLLLGFLILGASSATAIPIPIPDNPLLGGGAVEKLTRGSGTSNYQFVLEGTEFEPGWSNKQGDKIRIDIGFTPNVSSNFETMVVFTSIRFGVASNPVTCAELAPGGTNPLPLADFGFDTSPASVGGLWIASRSRPTIVPTRARSLKFARQKMGMIYSRWCLMRPRWVPR